MPSERSAARIRIGNQHERKKKQSAGASSDTLRIIAGCGLCVVFGLGAYLVWELRRVPAEPPQRGAKLLVCASIHAAPHGAQEGVQRE